MNDDEQLNPYEASRLPTQVAATNSSWEFDDNASVRRYLLAHLLAVIGGAVLSLHDLRRIPNDGWWVLMVPLSICGAIGSVFLFLAPLAILYFMYQAACNKPRRFFALLAELCLWPAHMFALLPLVQ